MIPYAIAGIKELDERTKGIGLSGQGDVIIDQGNLGIETTGLASGYKLDVNGKIKGGGTAEAWSAERTGGTTGTTWTTIPGLDITFTLSRSALVQFNSTGGQRSTSGTCQTAYRFEVDSVARGDANYGQRLYVSNSADAWWVMWALSDFANMSAGSHTVRVQARESGAGTTPCYICMESGGTLTGYSGCNLNIAAFYN
jgi:hypothetical protein